MWPPRRARRWWDAPGPLVAGDWHCDRLSGEQAARLWEEVLLLPIRSAVQRRGPASNPQWRCSARPLGDSPRAAAEARGSRRLAFRPGPVLPWCRPVGMSPPAAAAGWRSVRPLVDPGQAVRRPRWFQTGSIPASEERLDHEGRRQGAPSRCARDGRRPVLALRWPRQEAAAGWHSAPPPGEPEQAVPRPRQRQSSPIQEPEKWAVEQQHFPAEPTNRAGQYRRQRARHLCSGQALLHWELSRQTQMPRQEAAADWHSDRPRGDPEPAARRPRRPQACATSEREEGVAEQHRPEAPTHRGGGVRHGSAHGLRPPRRFLDGQLSWLAECRRSANPTTGWHPSSPPDARRSTDPGRQNPVPNRRPVPSHP